MGSSERRSRKEKKRKEVDGIDGIDRILIEEIRVSRGQIRKHPLELVYDFNKEAYKDAVTGERFLFAGAHYNGRLEDGLEYECHIKFRCYSDDDYSKMATKDALARFTQRVNAKYYNPEKGTLRMAIHRAISLMSKYTDRSYANREAVHKKHA